MFKTLLLLLIEFFFSGLFFACFVIENVNIFSLLKKEFNKTN